MYGCAGSALAFVGSLKLVLILKKLEGFSCF